MDAIYTEKRHGLTIKIYQDDNAVSPREWDNLGTMVCFHRHYTLGDKHDMSIEEAQEFIKRKDVFSLPLFLYDHSGISMSTRSYLGRAQHAEWDSGQVGFIYITKERIKKEFCTAGRKNIARAMYCLKSEVKVYNEYLTENVYGYTIEDETGEIIESCYGFYEDYDDKGYSALSEAQSVVDNITHNGTTTANGQQLIQFAEVLPC